MCIEDESYVLKMSRRKLKKRSRDVNCDKRKRYRTRRRKSSKMICQT